MANSIEQQKKLNALVKEQVKITQQNTKSLKSSLAVMAQIAAVQKTMTEGSGSIVENYEEIQEAIEETTKKNGILKSSIQEAFKEEQKEMKKSVSFYDVFSDKISKLIKKYKIFSVAAVGFSSGFIKSVSFQINLMKSFIGLTGSLASGFWDVGKAIVSIPFKMLDAAFALANKLRAMWEANRRAIEEIRKEFGALTSFTGKQVMDTFRNLSGQLGETGLSVYSVFGTVEDRLKFVNKLFMDMGTIVFSFDKEIARNIKTLASFQKGLGLSGEDMGSLAVRAKSTGKTITDELRDVVKYSTLMEKVTGINRKAFARDMAFMSKDVSHFGAMSQKSMAEASAYTELLGVDVKSLKGIVDKFLDFKDAATNAAKLSQIFGANVDVMKMMRAASEDPAKGLRTLQDAMFRAGRTADKMNLAELRVLASTTGLTEQEAKLAFSLKARGMTLDQIKAKTSGAEKKQMSMEEAVSKMGDSIDRLIKALPQLNGFFDAFAKGFSRGMVRSKGFMAALQGLYDSAFQVGLGAIKIGEAFTKSFPGVENFFDGFTKLFNAEKFSKLMDGVFESFSIFFRMLGDPKEADKAFEYLFNNLGMDFENNFKEDSDFIKTVKSSFISFATSLRDIIIGIIPKAVEGMTEIFVKLTEFMENPDKYSSKTKGAKKGIGAFFAPLIKAIYDGATNPKFLEAIVNFGNTFLKKMVKVLSKLPWKAWIAPVALAALTGLWHGFLALAPWILKKVGKFLLKTLWSLVKWVGKKMWKLGTFLVKGIWNSLKLAWKKLPDLGKFLLKHLKRAGKTIAKFAPKLFRGIFTGLKTGVKKLPFIGALAELGLTIYRIGKNWDKAKGFLPNLQMALKEITSGAISVLTFGLSDIFPSFKAKIMEGIEWMRKKHFEFMLWLLGDPADMEHKGIFVRVWDFAMKKAGSAVEFFKKKSGAIFNALVSPFKQMFSYLKENNMETIMKDFAGFIVKGFGEGIKTLEDVLPASFKTTLELVRKVLDMKSPSGVFQGIGQNLSKGMMVGVKNIPLQMENVVGEAVNRAEMKMKSGGHNLSSISEDIQKRFSSLPAFNVEAKLGSDLKVKNQGYKVEFDKINMEVNLNVSIDADTLADALIKTKKVVSVGKALG